MAEPISMKMAALDSLQFLQKSEHYWGIIAHDRNYVTQVECTSYARAYPDCDQYVTGVQGTIMSYNHPGSLQLQAKDYQHCIRREAGIAELLLFHAA